MKKDFSLNKRFKNFYFRWLDEFYPRYYDTLDEFIASQYEYDSGYFERFCKDYSLVDRTEYNKQVILADKLYKTLWQKSEKKYKKKSVMKLMKMSGEEFLNVICPTGA